MGTRLGPGVLARSWSLFPWLAFQQICLSRLLTFSLILLHEGGQRAARLPRLLITLPLCPARGRAARTERCSVTAQQTRGAKDGHGGADGAWAGQQQPWLALPAAPHPRAGTPLCQQLHWDHHHRSPGTPRCQNAEKSCLCQSKKKQRAGQGHKAGVPTLPVPHPQQPQGSTQHTAPPAHTTTPLGSAGHRCHRGSPDPPGRRRCPSCCCLPRCSSRRLCRLIKQILHLLGGSRARQGSSRGDTERGGVEFSFLRSPPDAAAV